jgi:hypothetical protein
MSMPASGCLGILSCPGSVACTSISQAVSGNVTPPKSLCALSVSAGKSAPHGMTEFYGYGPVAKAVDFLCITCVGNNTATARSCSSLSVSPAMSTGECYCPCFCWRVGMDIDAGISAYFTVARNGSTVQTCSAGIDGNICVGCFSMCVVSGDTVCITTYGKKGTIAGDISQAMVCMYSMAAGGSSNITKGTTRTVQCSATCGTLP